jgi:putative endonuclease
MFTVYVLHSEKYDKIYIGFSGDLDKRLLSHNELSKKGYTARYRPWKIIYTEEFDSKEKAMKREKELKSSRGRTYLRTIING